jgi:hypothetical protein
VLAFADYKGLDVAVSETAEAAMASLDAAAKAELPALVAGLVADVVADPLTGEQRPMVVALDRRSFEAGRPARKSLIDAFVEQRLLTSEGDGAATRVRPVHEALLRIWPTAAAIVLEIAALIRVRHTLEPIVRAWAEADGEAKAGHLEISPALLDGARQAFGRFGDDLPAPMREFIGEALRLDAAKRERERAEQERKLRDARALAAARSRVAWISGPGLAAALALAAVAGWQWRDATAQRLEAQQSAREATTQRDLAVKETAEAEAQKAVADKSAQEAKAQRDRAENADLGDQDRQWPCV